MDSFDLMSNQKADPGRYGIGTNAAVEAIIKKFSARRTPCQGLVAINLATLVRNAVDVNKPAKTIVESICQTMQLISNDLLQVWRSWPKSKHYLVFYYANALKIVPTAFQRSFGGTAGMKYNEVMTLLLERLKSVPDQTHENMTSVVRLAPSFHLPSWKGLRDVCNELVDKSVSLHLISHQPTDWHIASTGRMCVLYRSHTGKEISMTNENLGQLAFGVPGVPFHPITHVLLGDKSMLKGLYVRKERTEFIKYCQLQRLALHSEVYVNDKLKNNARVLPYRLD